jgi:hypothetical protein
LRAVADAADLPEDPAKLDAVLDPPVVGSGHATDCHRNSSESDYEDEDLVRAHGFQTIDLALAATKRHAA